MSFITKIPAPYSGWIPANKPTEKELLKRVNRAARQPYSRRAPHVPAVQKFEAAIRSDAVMLELFNRIFLQKAHIPGVEDQPGSFDQLLYMIDVIVVAPPSFLASVDEGGQPVGVPLYAAVFDLISNTSAAYDLFRIPAFNVAMKELLDSWGQYLLTEDSSKTLNEGPEGWFSPEAIRLLDDGRGEFNATYVVPDPTAVNRGYNSWNDFFCREILPEARPILEPENEDLIINACESTTFKIARNVSLHDQFWLKTQNYSLYDILNGCENAQQFVGGTVYQAFLGPVDYHRWHAPIDGTIEKIEVLPGSYYAALPDEGDPLLGDRAPEGALIRSQAWLTMTATRALFFIRAKNKKIGLMCFIAIGMAEVSTCFVTAKQGEVKKGDQLGMFRFGGSSHALVFQRQANVQFFDNVEEDNHLLVNTTIAHV